MRAVDQRLDPLTEATVTVAWVIIANKPFYPVYVWYLVGDGVYASLWTLAAAPLLLTIPFLAKRSPLAARIALPLIGTLDTLFETKLFGQNSGTELFFAACTMDLTSGRTMSGTMRFAGNGHTRGGMGAAHDLALRSVLVWPSKVGA